jgi:hypothetical protein
VSIPHAFTCTGFQSELLVAANIPSKKYSTVIIYNLETFDKPKIKKAPINERCFFLLVFRRTMRHFWYFNNNIFLNICQYNFTNKSTEMRLNHRQFCSFNIRCSNFILK